MKIEILGTGCPKCQRLEQNVRKALEESAKKAEIIKVTTVEEIISYGIMSTPALIIDGEVKVYGMVCSIEEIKEMLS